MLFCKFSAVILKWNTKFKDIQADLVQDLIHVVVGKTVLFCMNGLRTSFLFWGVVVVMWWSIALPQGGIPLPTYWPAGDEEGWQVTLTIFSRGKIAIQINFTVAFLLCLFGIFKESLRHSLESRSCTTENCPSWNWWSNKYTFVYQCCVVPFD